MNKRTGIKWHLALGKKFFYSVRKKIMKVMYSERRKSFPIYSTAKRGNINVVEYNIKWHLINSVLCISLVCRLVD